MFIVLEGSDGSGKTTQFKLLSERLRAAGHEVDVYDFPRYNESSSYFVQRYLNGEYGPASEVSPYIASLFYALDRFEAAPLIRQSLADGKIVLANRYAGSNMAHQGAKFTKAAEQRGFFVWADSLEYQLLGIPRPSVNIFLRVPADVAYRLIKKKAARSYTAKIHDEHEADIEHLRQSVTTYDTLCQLFPKDFKAVECTKNNKILPVTAINNHLWEVLKPLLPKPTRPGHSATVTLDNKRPRADEKKSIKTTRQSTKPDATFEDTPEAKEVKDISLLAANNLRRQGLDIEYKLQWPPQPAKPRLSYYIPAELPPKLANKYQETMNKIAELSHRMSKSMPDSAKKYLTNAAPLAALVDAKISGRGLLTKPLLSNGAATDLNELSQITKQIRSQLKEPQELGNIIKQIADTRLAANSGDYSQPVRLISVLPRNELDLVADCLYQYSNLGRDEIAAQIDNWTYEQKAQALKAICNSDVSSILQKIRYKFDVVADWPTLESLANQLEPSEIQIQPPTPRYGYQVPAEIEQAALDESFIECFDLSLGLYSDIQAAGLEQLADYAVLAGHRQRWQFNVSGQSILIDAQAKKSPKNIIGLLKEQVAQVHPLIIESLKTKRLGTMKTTQKDQQITKKSGQRRRGQRKSTESQK